MRSLLRRGDRAGDVQRRALLPASTVPVEWMAGEVEAEKLTLVSEPRHFVPWFRRFELEGNLVAFAEERALPRLAGLASDRGVFDTSIQIVHQRGTVLPE